LRRVKPVCRFIGSTAGVAGIEFSMVLPILILLLLAFYDAGTALAIYTKTRFATATLAEITNQYNSSSEPIHDADMTRHRQLEHQPHRGFEFPAADGTGDSQQLFDLRHGQLHLQAGVRLFRERSDQPFRFHVRFTAKQCVDFAHISIGTDRK
jgi:hypothetical protein